MKIFKPRRGKRATAISKSIVLQNGEVFFEVPSDGVGKGRGKILMGDGTTGYENLPVFLEVPASLPASDVYNWAKAQNKPTYTASEVGLGNVPNVTTDNQTPTVTEATTRANLANNDTLKTIIGKIKKYFADLGSAAFKNIPSSGDASSDQVVLGNDTRLSNQRTPVAHNQAASTITAGTLGGKVQANEAAQQVITDFMLRNIKISDQDITAGSTTLPAGSIYMVF